MKTHYLAHAPKTSVCGVRKPLRATRKVEAVDCPSCLAWINKNMQIRTKQIQSRGPSHV